MRKRILILIGAAILLNGCTGWTLPQPFSNKPYTYLHTGEPFGRDQLTNRLLVANKLLPLMKGKDSNEVLTLLGQPQQIKTVQRNISEDWYFTYYKTHIPYNPADSILPDKRGEFVIRFENDQVIDVIKRS